MSLFAHTNESLARFEACNWVGRTNNGRGGVRLLGVSGSSGVLANMPGFVSRAHYRTSVLPHFSTCFSSFLKCLQHLFFRVIYGKVATRVGVFLKTVQNLFLTDSPSPPLKRTVDGL